MKKERLRMNINPNCEVARNINHNHDMLHDLVIDNGLMREEIRSLRRMLERGTNQIDGWDPEAAPKKSKPCNGCRKNCEAQGVAQKRLAFEHVLTGQKMVSAIDSIMEDIAYGMGASGFEELVDMIVHEIITITSSYAPAAGEAIKKAHSAE